VLAVQAYFTGARHKETGDQSFCRRLAGTVLYDKAIDRTFGDVQVLHCVDIAESFLRPIVSIAYIVFFLHSSKR